MKARVPLRMPPEAPRRVSRAFAPRTQGAVVPGSGLPSTGQRSESVAPPAAGATGVPARYSRFTIFPDSTQQARGSVVQRAAGIEYETNISARETATYDGDPETYNGFVAQDERMYDSGNGWMIDSDNSKLEFVTEPPVAVDALGAVITNMMDAIDAATPTLYGIGQGVQAELGDLFPGGNVSKAYTILPYNKNPLTGSPQGTIGVPFGQLFKFFDVLTRYGLTSSQEVIDLHQKTLNKKLGQDGIAPNARATWIDMMRQERASGPTAISRGTTDLFGEVRAAVETVTADSALPNADLTRLKGLLHMFGQYARLATEYQGVTYKKIAFPVMARTSFHSMYAALSEDAQAAFGGTAEALLGRLGLDRESIAFPAHRLTVFTIGSWLDSIREPSEVNVPGSDPRPSDKMTAPGAGVAPINGGHLTDKSMGSMGLDDGELVVVELRGLKHFARFGTFTTSSMRKLAADLSSLLQKSE